MAPRGATKPAGFDASDPSSPAYDFSYVEDAVRDASRRGLKVILTVVHAPRWAEAPDKPAGSAAGAWRPDPGELASFVRAAARRFSGFYPDPKAQQQEPLLGGGGELPHVRYWQIWEEPNANRTLQPLYAGGRLVAADHYRAMLDASARALKAVDEDNLVVAGGTTARKGRGAAPLAFWRKLLSRRARFDVAAQEEFGGGRPSGGQLRGIRRLVRPKPLWVTKLGWETPPLAPRGVSVRTQARYLAEGIYRSERAGASLVIWCGLQDRVTYIPESFPSVRSGLYFDEGLGSRPKPSLAAYRFPFLVRRAGRGSRAWGIPPSRGRVAIQRRYRRGWRTVARGRGSRTRGFRIHLRQGRGRYRARQGRTVSAVWRR